MRQWYLSLVIGSVLFLIYLLVFYHNQSQELVSPLVEIPPMEYLSLTPNQEITPTTSPNLVLEETKIITPSHTIKKVTPTITPIPTAVDSEVIYKMIDKYAQMGGIDPNVVRYMAICESGFRSNAINGIYVGLFQFAPQSWKNLRIEMGKDSDINLRFSPEESIQTVVYALSKGKEKMWPNCLPK